MKFKYSYSAGEYTVTPPNNNLDVPDWTRAFVVAHKDAVNWKRMGEITMIHITTAQPPWKAKTFDMTGQEIDLGG